MIVVVVGVRFVANPCNLDTLGYHNLFVYCVAAMQYKLEFSFPEVVGLHSAIEIAQHTGAFFAMACNIFLHLAGRTKGSRATCQSLRGRLQVYKIRYFVATLSCNLFYEFRHYWMKGKGKDLSLIHI